MASVPFATPAQCCDASEFGVFAFEAGHLGSLDERGRTEDALKAVADFLGHLRMSRRQVDERNALRYLCHCQSSRE